MATHTGVTSARAVCKPCSSPSLSRSSSTNKLVRRRGRGSLVRCRAFVWSKEDLLKLHELAKRPRHEVSSDIIDHYALTDSSSHPPSPESSTCSDLEGMHNQNPTAFIGAVDPQLDETNSAPSASDSLCNSLDDSAPPVPQPSNLSTSSVTTSKPPLQRMHQSSHTLAERQNLLQLPAHSHHSVTPEPSAINQSNLAVVSGIASRLIDLKL